MNVDQLQQNNVSLLAYKVSAFLDTSNVPRHVVTSRQTGAPGVAASLYESYLALRSDSAKSRSAMLYALASLYSWAEFTELEFDLDARLIGGLGLSATEVTAFSAWLRVRLSGSKRAVLPATARGNYNQILHFCRQACVHFITQYGPVSDLSVDRVRQIELLVRAQERVWQKARVKNRNQRVAPDLTDDELRRIETYLLPANRAAEVGEAIAHRDYLIWRLTIEFGLRIGEILSLRIQDCPSAGRDFLSIVRIEEREGDATDPRGANAPRPKTLSRDLRSLWQHSNAFKQIGLYATRFRRARVHEHGRYVFRWLLPHPFLLVGAKGMPLSVSTTNDVASAIKRATGIDFHWHLGRHAFFNRMYLNAKSNQELQDLVYWGGWESDKSLLIYSRRARADRARGVMKSENEKCAWMALS